MKNLKLETAIQPIWERREIRSRIHPKIKEFVRQVCEHYPDMSGSQIIHQLFKREARRINRKKNEQANQNPKSTIEQGLQESTGTHDRGGE